LNGRAIDEHPVKNGQGLTSIMNKYYGKHLEFPISKMAQMI
jgi:hypothetical protein